MPSLATNPVAGQFLEENPKQDHLLEPVLIEQQISELLQIVGLEVFKLSRNPEIVFEIDLEELCELIRKNIDKVINLFSKIENEELKILRIQNALVDSIFEIIGLRYDYLVDHMKRVTVVAVGIARHLGFSLEAQNYVRLASLLHDIGKVKLDPELLNLELRYNEGQYEEMKTHPILAIELLQNCDFFSQEVLYGILDHHKDHGGGGYPERKKEELISIIGEIIHVADCFLAAQEKNRGYKRTPSKKIRHALKDLEGKIKPYDYAVRFTKNGTTEKRFPAMFNPLIVEALEKYLRSEGLVH